MPICLSNFLGSLCLIWLLGDNNGSSYSARDDLRLPLFRLLVAI